MDSLPLLIYLCATVLTPCHGFSLDTEQPTVFQEAALGFGQSVAQFGSGRNGGLLVGAPLQKGGVNETGKLYKCQPGPRRSGSCQEVLVQRPIDAVNMSLGMSVSVQDSQLLVCGPTVHQTCGKNIYLKGYCFHLDENLREIQHFPKNQTECSNQRSDIVFLIDGSGSIKRHEFPQMKTFISEVIKRFENTDTQFALAQYSNLYQEHFNFLQFKNTRDPNTLLIPVRQLFGTTHTATFIQKVVRELFVPAKGSRSGASKILIVITDGEKFEDKLEYSDVIPEADNAGIIRFAIGVGAAFSQGKPRQELNTIASYPPSDHVFSVNNFNALKDIQNKLEDKIFAIEGTHSQGGTSQSSFQYEMSQEGFSALLTPVGPILGAVGANDWSGGLFLYGDPDKPAFIDVPSSTKDMKDAYLGYVMQMVQVNGQSSFVVGAPRYQHAGKVFLFSRQNLQWQKTSELSPKESPQIGSYFGATLCSVDLDRDKNTDLVLIGAPMYYDGMAGGVVYICERQEDGFFCSQKLRGAAKQPLGRFGASIAEIGEITGDRWTDVAIGAPMEDENRGAVYIFHGSRRSINPAYSQRIQGSLLPNRLHYFGQAIGAGRDLTGDGLPDVAVGAQGRVLLLRARPVVRVVPTITFTPNEIPIAAFECQDQDVLNKEVSKATVCLTVMMDPRFTQGSSILNTIQYKLNLDPGRMRVRAIFNGNPDSSIITKEIKMGLKRHCEEYRIKLPTCVEDSFTPINLRLNYTLIGDPIPGADNLQAILSKDSSPIFTAPLHFQKNCGADGVCKDQLKTSFNFSGLDTLVVGLTPELNATVFIRNDGEDSYGTTITFFYPSALSYRRLSFLKSKRRNVAVKCASTPSAEDDPMRNTTCNINHPIFRAGAEAVFIATFSVSQNADLGREIQINATAGSDNNGPVTPDMIHQAKLLVKYAVYVFVNAVDVSTKYVNFSAGQEDGNQTVEHRYEVKNTYTRKVPVSITFKFPVQLNGTWVWNASADILPEMNHLVQCAPEADTQGAKDFVAELRKNSILDCSVAVCKTIRCNIPSLGQKQPLEFSIKGKMGFQWVSQTQQKKVTLVSSARISYDEKIYTQKEGLPQNQANTVVEFLEPYNYLPVIIGSSVGGLILLALIAAVLYKVGFFKRQYKQMMEAGDGEVAGSPQQDSGAGPSSAATKG
ncbi:integrin alpha-M-like isoform X1 [Podarcis lilfordi]|uniref:Integrin alpha-M-like isoform X1 n=2 Tax=Podarcis lilfordi TaxID=74358 RepID=A0AA35L822_9SAUR|nr:integrin alpha-M-like isoform X1 [Podarcis lilfordi]